MNLQCTFMQGFGGNANPYYINAGLKGHTGIDEACGYGSEIKAYKEGFVYSLYPIESPANDGYTAIFTLCRTPLEVFEFSYGHVSEIDCKIGDNVKKGQVIGKEGNHGVVYSGDTLITLAMQKAGDHRGAHRHIQKRIVSPVAKTSYQYNYLQTAKGIYRDETGFYYQIINYWNGFNGCVDWTAPLFNRDLYLGVSGYDVTLLQRALKLEGFFDVEPTGFYGPKTLSAVSKFQTVNHLSPTFGYCGQKTRAILNLRYSQL